MVKIQQIFDMAIDMLDEQDEQTGKTMTEDTQEYAHRAVSIINQVLPVLYPYSDTYDPNVKAPILTDGLDFDQYIPLSDDLALAVLPAYLAATIIKPENDVLAAWFMDRYRESLYEVKRNSASDWEAIPTPYGTF